MPFPWTLQRYIFREISKTFMLTALALTVVLGLGGGVVNMMKLGEVTGGQVVRLMAMLLPLAMALTLPVAALFSATATYGRLSADNEFVACRASGINMHVLFFPTVVLSFVAGGTCFVFTSFVIPRMVRNLNTFVSVDAAALIQKELNRPDGIVVDGRFRIYADRCVASADDPNRITLIGGALIEMDQGEVVRYGTFREGRINIERDRDPPRLSAVAIGVSSYDRRQGAFFEEGEQVFGTTDLPSTLPSRIKFLDLGELLHYRAAPTAWFEVREKMDDLRAAARALAVQSWLWRSLRDNQRLTLEDDTHRYVISGTPPSTMPMESGFHLEGVHIDQQTIAAPSKVDADYATIDVGGDATPTGVSVRIQLTDARLYDGDTTIRRSTLILDPVHAATAVLDEMNTRSDEQILAYAGSSPVEALREAGDKVAVEQSRTLRHISGVLHERAALSVSVFVLVFLGAALGIVFRGAHVMTSFCISFVPALVIIVTIVMGKQMAHNESTYLVGLCVLWSGILTAAALDVWVLGRVLRR